jgi:phosphotriesterase-related protein
MKPYFRTVLGDVPVDQMGICYAHEHIVIEESFPTMQNHEFLLNDEEKISRELTDFHRNGGRTVVDTMPANCGRNVLKLAEVSRRSEVHIIVPTGIHLEIYYVPNHWRYHYTEDQLTRLFIDDIEVGIDRLDYGGPIVERTSHKAGMIKLATGDDPITPHQEKIFRAVVNAHLETGAPILTHTNFGRQALEQALLFDKLGADLKHVVLSHVDRNKDIAYHKDILATGVYLEYDSAFRWKEGENWTYKMLEALLPDYSRQLVLGMDMAKNIYWKSYGGKPGLTFLLEEIPKKLKSWGMAELYEKIFIENPARLYCFKQKGI